MFSKKETKTAPKKPLLFCLVRQVPDYFRFPKTSEDSPRPPKESKDNWRFTRRNPRIFQEQIRTELKMLKDFFQKTLLTLNSSFFAKTVNKKIGQFCSKHQKLLVNNAQHKMKNTKWNEILTFIMLTSFWLLDYDVLRIILVLPPKINISINCSVP